MRFFFRNYHIISNILFILLALSAITLIGLHFYSLIQGFYLTGDTISALDIALHSRPGSIFQIFKLHFAVWPPGLAYIFNFISILPFSIVSQNHIYVLLVSLLNIIVMYFIARNITQSLIIKISIISLSLFSGIHSLLFLSSIAEPLFVLLWLATIYFMARFIEVKNENFILLLIATMATLPLVRYSGIWVNFSFILILLIFIFFDRIRKYSVKFIIISLILLWMPILIYLLRNSLTDVSIFGLRDFQFKNVTFSIVSIQLLQTMVQDLKIPFIFGSLLGTLINWSTKVRNILILSSISSLIYLTGLVLSQTKYRFYEHFPSRFPGISYPEILLATVAIGSFFSWKYPIIKKLKPLTILLVIIFFGYQIFITSHRLNLEKESLAMWIPYIENSQDLRRLCRGKRKDKYLFIQDSSRNWVGQSLRFYCLPIEKISTNTSLVKLPQNALIYTPYKLTISSLKEEEVYGKEYKIYVYRTEAPLDFNVKEEIKKRNNPLE